MHKAADARFPSAGDLARAARAAAAGGLPAEPERMIARGAAAPEGAPQELGLAPESVTVSAARPTALMAPEPAPRARRWALAAVACAAAAAAATVVLLLDGEPSGARRGGCGPHTYPEPAGGGARRVDHARRRPPAECDRVHRRRPCGSPATGTRT